jgi:hypothetical protein
MMARRPTKVDVNADSTVSGTAMIKPMSSINGDEGTITAGTGNNAVSIDGTKGTLDVGKEISMDGKTGDASFGKVDINGAEGTIGGLTNTTWAPDNYTSGQAATEDQLKAVSDAADQAAETAKKHSTVTVNNGKANGSLVMNTSENENGGTNYDISLGDEINVGGTNGKDGSIGVNGKDGTNGVTITAGEGARRPYRSERQGRFLGEYLRERRGCRCERERRRNHDPCRL